MIELIFGIFGFAFLALAVWWTDRVKKYYEDED
jgi:hypothetical protein